MKKLFKIIVFNFLLINNIYAEIQWPEFMAKEIPLSLLKTYEKQSTGLDGFSDLLKQFNLNDPKTKKMLLKTLIQTMNADLELGKLNISNEEEKLLKKLLGKYK